MSNGVKGWFVKADFRYDAARDVYVCPAGDELTYRYTREERGVQVRRYWINNCQTCVLRQRRTTGTERRITRWEHEHLVDDMLARLGRDPRQSAAFSLLANNGAQKIGEPKAV